MKTILVISICLLCTSVVFSDRLSWQNSNNARNRFKREVVATETASAPAATHPPSAVPVNQPPPQANQAPSNQQSQYPNPQQSYQMPPSMPVQDPYQVSHGVAAPIDPNHPAYSGSVQMQAPYGIPLHQSIGSLGHHSLSSRDLGFRFDDDRRHSFGRDPFRRIPYYPGYGLDGRRRRRGSREYSIRGSSHEYGRRGGYSDERRRYRGGRYGSKEHGLPLYRRDGSHEYGGNRYSNERGFGRHGYGHGFGHGLSFLNGHSGEYGRFPSRFNHHGRYPFEYDPDYSGSFESSLYGFPSRHFGRYGGRHLFGRSRERRFGSRERRYGSRERRGSRERNYGLRGSRERGQRRSYERGSSERRREKGNSYEKSKKSSREEKAYQQPTYTENRASYLPPEYAARQPPQPGYNQPQRNSKERYSDANKERPKGYSSEKGLSKTLSEKTSSIADGLNKIEAKVADVIREQNKPY